MKTHYRPPHRKVVEAMCGVKPESTTNKMKNVTCIRCLLSMAKAIKDDIVKRQAARRILLERAAELSEKRRVS